MMAAAAHLVGVHVALRAAAGLPDDQREVVDQLASRHLRRCIDDGIAHLLVQHALIHVHLHGGWLNIS